jgi:hypothetical protein
MTQSVAYLPMIGIGGRAHHGAERNRAPPLHP